MSKTSRKSLPTFVLAFCLLIAQAALFVHSSNTGVAHAASGAQIFANPASVTQGAGQAVAIRGTGFVTNSTILLFFNAPYSSDGSPLGPRSIPPTVNRPGDNRIEPVSWYGPAACSVVNTCLPNSIVVQANTDGLGNLVTSNGNNGTVYIYVPRTAVDGIYEIVAVDAGGDVAATQYTISRSASQNLAVTPVSGSSVQIGGVVNVTASPNSFNNGDEVRFYLEDFAASASYSVNDVPSYENFDPLQAPASPQVPLQILSCGSTPVPSATTFCAASINGDVTAQVQLITAEGAPQPCILSTYYYDQVFAIVAKSVGNTYGLPTSGNVWEAGVHVDHGQTQISLSSNQLNTGQAIVVRGIGFAAFSPVTLWLVTIPQPTSSPCSLVNAVSDFEGCKLTTVLTDANGAFQVTVTTGVATGLPGYVLAEDYAGTYPDGTNLSCFGARLNEAATAALTVVSNPGVGRLTLLTAAGGLNNTAAVSSTIVFTGSAFTPNEAVELILTGPLSTPGTAPLPPGAPVGLPGSASCAPQVVVVVHANAAGVATGSFLVPETCNTVTVSGGRINAGAKVSVDAVGEQSGVDDNTSVTIPPTTALITPTNGITQTGTSITVTLSGDGFAANEPVTFQFGSINPFTGIITNPVLSISGVADATGHVSIPNQSISSANLGTGTLFVLKATGLNSSFTTSVSVNVPFLPNEGNLNCPTSPVLPGQPFVVSGSNFAQNGQTSLFFPGSTALVTVNFPNFPSVPVTIAGDGTFAVTLTAPLGTAPNSYLLVVSGLILAGGTLQEQLRQCTITIGTTAPVITSSLSSGPIGITTTVTGHGFAPNEPIVLSLKYIGTSPLSGTDVPGTQQAIGNADANGNFVGVFTVKSTVAALIQGQYWIAATGQNTGLKAYTTFTVTGGLSSPLVTQLFFAEGFTGTASATTGVNANFVETISVLNANNYTTTYTITYYLEQTPGAPSITQNVTGTIGPNSVQEHSVNTEVGLNQKVAAQVSSPAPLAAERIISRTDASGKALDSSSSLGQLLNLTSGTAPFNYYFASGEVQLTNEEYLTLLNPGSTAANVTIQILPQAALSSTTVGAAPSFTQLVPANSRVTVPIRAKMTTSGITQFGMAITSDQPVAAERVEYYGDGIGSGKYGATTKPSGTAPFRQYIFAGTVGTAPSSGGANTLIGTGSDISEIDIVNPNTARTASSATVTVSFFDKSGHAINSQQVQVDGGSRQTVKVNDVAGTQTDVFSIVVTADQNIFVERPQFFGGDPSAGGTFAASNPSGSPAGLTSVAFPYLDLTGPTGAAISQTVFLYNPGATAIQVRGTYVSGQQSVAVIYTVAPNSITTANVNTDAATLPKGGLGAIFQVVQTGTSSSSNNTSVQTGNGDSFVAEAQSNSPDFKMVTAEQGTYPIGAATGP